MAFEFLVTSQPHRESAAPFWQVAVALTKDSYLAVLADGSDRIAVSPTGLACCSSPTKLLNHDVNHIPILHAKLHPTKSRCSR
jgi:hypothetical protein